MARSFPTACLPCVEPLAVRRLQDYFRRRRQPQRRASNGFCWCQGRAPLHCSRRCSVSSHHQAGRYPSGGSSGVNRGRTVRRSAAVFPPHVLTHSLAYRYGPKVEEFFEVYLKTPGLPREDVTKALLARGAARRAAAERLMVKAKQGAHIVQQPSSGLIEEHRHSRSVQT